MGNIGLEMRECLFFWVSLGAPVQISYSCANGYLRPLRCASVYRTAFLISHIFRKM